MHTTEENLWVSYGPFVRTILRRYAGMLGRLDAALWSWEDLLQDAYVVFRAARAYYDHTRGVPFPAYFSMLLSRALLARYRQARRRQEAWQRVVDDANLAVPVPPDPGPDLRLVLHRIFISSTKAERQLILSMLGEAPGLDALARRRRMRIGSGRLSQVYWGWSRRTWHRTLTRLRRRVRRALTAEVPWQRPVPKAASRPDNPDERRRAIRSVVVRARSAS